MKRPTSHVYREAYPLSLIKHAIHAHLPAMSPDTLGYFLLILSLSLFTLAISFSTVLRTPLRFAYNCFIKPFFHASQSEQKDRLADFYAGQADVYDTTRTHLLEGRETMLQLLAAHLKAQPVPSSIGGMTKPKIWVDIGGGTGWNIEKM